MAKKVLAVFAHPDDEILGCGGALSEHSASGDEVVVLLLATGLTSRGEVKPEEIEQLRNQAREAADIVGAERVEFGDFPDNEMDTVPLLEVVKRIEKLVAQFPPDVIYTHFAGDLNIDHQITNRAVLTAMRPLPGSPASEILTCEINSSTEWLAPPTATFAPTDFLDISAHLNNKLAAMTCYRQELREWPHPRSLEGIRTLAAWRGTQIGRNAAEAFLCARRIRN
jgi:N-acetylglucosamine malate deacetylase 1